MLRIVNLPIFLSFSRDLLADIVSFTLQVQLKN